MQVGKEIDVVIRKAETQGWRHSRTTAGHHQFYSPDRKTIVTHSGTPSDWRAWHNFMADMKRGGYDDGRIVSMDMPQLIPDDGRSAPKLGMRQHIIEFLSKHVDNSGVPFQKVCDYVRVAMRKSDLTDNNISGTMSIMADQGRIYRIRKGVYSLQGPRPALPPPVPVIVEPPKPNGQGVSEPLSPRTDLGGMVTGDASTDEDLRLLDEALSALARIESVVRKNREVLVQFSKLKKLLNT